MARQMREPVYQMLWDCPYCGTRKLLGLSHRYCPHCGAPQDATRRYFPSDADKVAVEAHHYIGVDRLCPACSSPNAAASDYCAQCGAPLADATRAARLPDETRRAGERFAESHRTAAPPAPPRRTARSTRRRWIGLLLLAGLLGAWYLWSTWTVERTVQVTGVAWSRVIHIESKLPTAAEQWCEGMPQDAYDRSRSRRIRDYERIPHEQCDTITRRIDQGDGTYREVPQIQCRTVYRQGAPIYDDWCRYTVDRWQPVRTLRRTGTDHHPQWPEARLGRAGDCRGCERIGRRSAEYRLTLTEQGTGHVYECSVKMQTWAQTEIGARLLLPVRRMGGAPRCDKLFGMRQSPSTQHEF